MVRQRSGIIGVVTGRLDNPFIALALEQLSHRLQQQGLKTLIYSGDAESDLKVALTEYIEDFGYPSKSEKFTESDLSAYTRILCRRFEIIYVLFRSIDI